MMYLEYQRNEPKRNMILQFKYLVSEKELRVITIRKKKKKKKKAEEVKCPECLERPQKTSGELKHSKGT